MYVAFYIHIEKNGSAFILWTCTFHAWSFITPINENWLPIQSEIPSNIYSFFFHFPRCRSIATCLPIFAIVLLYCLQTHCAGMPYKQNANTKYTQQTISITDRNRWINRLVLAIFQSAHYSINILFFVFECWTNWPLVSNFPTSFRLHMFSSVAGAVCACLFSVLLLFYFVP